MERVGRETILARMPEGSIDWLETQKDPDGLLNKLVTDYRHKAGQKFKPLADTVERIHTQRGE